MRLYRKLKKANFENFAMVQTVFGDLKNIERTQPFLQGYGTGGFVVIKAEI